MQKGYHIVMGEPGPVPGEALKRAADLLGDDPKDPVLAGLRKEREARYGNKPDLGKFFTDALSKSSVFGQKLGKAGLNVGGLLIKPLDYALHHKGEIAAGMAGGAAAKTAMRLLLAGSGGLAPAVAIGAVGGAAGGALKEYVKQRSGLSIVEAGDKLIIDGLKNEFRRLGAADKGKVGKAALRGAVFGAAGAVLSDAIAENEWVQGQLSKIAMPQFGGPSAEESSPVPEATATPAATAEPTMTPTKAPAITPAAEATPTPKVSIPPTETVTATPSPTATATEVPPVKPSATPTEVPKPPTPAPTSVPSPEAAVPPVEIPPELVKMPSAIELPAGSNPWDEVSGYGEKYLGRSLTNAEKLLLTKELCRQSGIAVPVWGLNEGIDHTKLPVGFKLIFNDPVKKLLEELKAA